MYDNECEPFRILYASKSSSVATDTDEGRPLFFEGGGDGVGQFPKKYRAWGKNRASASYILSRSCLLL